MFYNCVKHTVGYSHLRKVATQSWLLIAKGICGLHIMKKISFLLFHSFQCCKPHLGTRKHLKTLAYVVYFLNIIWTHLQSDKPCHREVNIKGMAHCIGMANSALQKQTLLTIRNRKVGKYKRLEKITCIDTATASFDDQ